MKTNYNQYRFTVIEIIRYGAEAAGICIGVNYLCYQTIWAFIPMILFLFFYLKWKKQELIKRRKETLGYQFKDAVHSLNVALNAGYSMENAIGECIRDLANLYRKDEAIMKEFSYIQSQLKVSVPIENLFMDLGRRSDVEDIQNFASVYSIAKRSGGNLSRVMHKTADMLEEKIETKQEIDAAIAAKKMEQGVMSVVPCGIILYMQITSPGFLDVLYGNITGIVVMTVCLGGYVMAYRAGKRMVEVEV